MHSGEVLAELVRGYLHLQMAHLSIIHHVLEYFIWLFILCTETKGGISHKNAPEEFLLCKSWKHKVTLRVFSKFYCSLYFQRLKDLSRLLLSPSLRRCLSHTGALGDILFR